MGTGRTEQRPAKEGGLCAGVDKPTAVGPVAGFELGDTPNVPERTFYSP